MPPRPPRTLQRWLDDKTRPQHYMPFSTGSRMCGGTEVVYLESRVVRRGGGGRGGMRHGMSECCVPRVARGETRQEWH